MTSMPQIPEFNKWDKSQKKLVKGIYEWVEAAVFSLLCVSVIFTFLFRIVGVNGNSMYDTLQSGERLVISRFLYTPKRGDIVIINRYRYNQEPLVKRIIAVGGDTLEIDEDTFEVKVNGKTLKEPYIVGVTKPIDYQNEYKDKPIPEGYVFVMGDNREESRDSRFMYDIGLVREEDIIGKALFRFYPISRAGGLY